MSRRAVLVIIIILAQSNATIDAEHFPAEQTILYQVQYVPRSLAVVTSREGVPALLYKILSHYKAMLESLTQRQTYVCVCRLHVRGEYKGDGDNHVGLDRYFLLLKQEAVDCRFEIDPIYQYRVVGELDSDPAPEGYVVITLSDTYVVFQKM